jgi:hypothetical protein
MSLLDLINPPQVEIKGARKVLNMTKKDDLDDDQRALLRKQKKKLRDATRRRRAKQREWLTKEKS